MTGWLTWPPQDDAEHSVTGHVLHLADADAHGLDSRGLWVCLPVGYNESDRRYPVLFLQDGQNLFDRAIAFGGEEWHADEALAAEAGRADAILVGIGNAGPQRVDEYSPFADERLGGGRGDAYVAYVTDRVKPLIDATFRTHPEREHTFIGGSSMGALIALHAFLARPDIFGGVAALSPSLWFARRAIFGELRRAPFTGGRVYADSGTREGPAMLLDMARLRHILLTSGYRKGVDLLIDIEPGGRHTESAWARRFPRALRFLLNVPEPSVAQPSADHSAATAPHTQPQQE